MNIELLRELANVDPEMITVDPAGRYADAYGFGLWSNTGFTCMRIFFDKNDGSLLQKPGGYNKPELFTKELFWVLLDRIQARGWGFVVSNFTWPNSDEPALMGGYTAFVHLTETGLMENEIEGCGGSPTEALARAYVNACKETK